MLRKKLIMILEGNWRGQADVTALWAFFCCRFRTKFKEDQTHPVPLSVSRSYTPLLIIYYDTTVHPIRKVQA